MAANQDKRSTQSGEVMLEAAIVFVPVLILLLAMLSLCFWFYQTAMMTNIASEIAAEVAHNLKYDRLEAHGDTLEVADMVKLKMFRSTFGLRGLETRQNERGGEYGRWRIPLTSLGLGPQEPSVKVELHNSGIGRTYVEVTVRQETGFFLSEILKYTGIEEEHPVFGGVAYAECVDLTEYTSMVNFLWFGSRELEVFEPFGHLYRSVMDLLDTLHII